MPQDHSRRISNQDYNAFMAVGTGPHQPTQVVPPSLVQSFTPELEAQILARHQAIATTLTTHLGQPFYSEGGFILYQADLVDFLAQLAATNLAIDLTITSPPYNIGKAYEQPMTVEDYVHWCAGWMGQIYQVTRTTGAFWLNVGYLEVPGQGLCVPIPYLLWDKSPFYLLQEVVWKYGAGVSTRHRLSPRNEKWLFYVKDPQAYTFNLDDIRDPNVKYPNQKKNGKYRCHPLGKNPSDVWEFAKVTTGTKRSSRERSAHPAQFPLAVVERIVRAASKPAEIVLDPFAGSGSTAIAACGAGRLFIGCEIRPDYCEMAVERFQAFQQKRREAAESKNQVDVRLS